MSFTSELYPGEVIIDESVTVQPANSGYVPRDYAVMPRGAVPAGDGKFADPFDISLIPRNEWDARIEELEAKKNRLSDLRLANNIPSLNQGSTNYCWCNAVISAMMILQAKQGGVITPLSPASVAAPIKGYRNQGGWGAEALDYIVKNGVAPVSLWPANAINRQYDNAESQAARAKFKILEWWELESQNFDQLATLLLLGIPCPLGLNWWSHEICALDLVKTGSNSYGTRIWNSWGDDNYGTKGMGVLSESKSRGDVVAPRSQFAV